MTENGSDSLLFEPPEQENIRLREENARLQRLLAVHGIPIPQLAPEDLIGRQVVCVVGFEPKRIAGFKSEVLVTGAISETAGVVLLRPDTSVENGSPIG